jgi:hypothetical protein
MGIFTDDLANVTGLAQPEEVHVILVSDGILETLAIPPAAGRWINAPGPRSSRLKAVVMLSYDYWQRHFAASPSTIGRILHVDAVPYQIVGVMPRNFRVASQDFDLLVPARPGPHQTEARRLRLPAASPACALASPFPRPTPTSPASSPSGWTPGPTAPAPTPTSTRPGRSPPTFARFKDRSPRQHSRHPLGRHGHHRARHAHRLRQRGKSSPRPRRRPPAGALHPRRSRRQPLAASPASSSSKA